MPVGCTRSEAAGFGRRLRRRVESTSPSLLIYGTLVAIGYAVEYHHRYREGALAQSQLETRLAHAQLDAVSADTRSP